ncbi:hypothetical protein [Priestia megaterium]|uniref:hypothetical protein n=1 Tax=Priestia megaterium TaxID=1404 RepID=UPI00196A9439|nr:hypothetical protein [Priestia megaterium]QSF42310.1 hypothetical protein ICR96_30180 [Priestia megaterium]
MHSKVRLKNKKSTNILLQISFIFILIDQFIISDIGSSLKVQDIGILLMIIGFYPIFKMVKANNKLKNLSLLFILYLFYIVITNLIFVSVYDLWFRHIFYILKEFEFFLIFLLTVYIMKSDKNNKFTLIIKLLLLLNLLYGFFQVAIGEVSYYGIGSLISPAPSVSGNVYFICSIIMFYFYKVEKKQYILIATILFIILTFFTVSRTYIISTILFFFIYYSIIFIFKGKKTFKTKNIIISAFLISIIALSILININLNVNNSKYLSNTTFISQIVNRMTNLDHSADVRANKTAFYYKTFIDDDVNVILFGKGKGITEQTFNMTTLAVDNQYMRALIEMGIIGTILWMVVILYIPTGLRVSNNLIEKSLFLALLGCYLAAAIGTELFQTVRPGTAFWFLTGLLYAKSSKTLFPCNKSS